MREVAIEALSNLDSNAVDTAGYIKSIGIVFQLIGQDDREEALEEAADYMHHDLSDSIATHSLKKELVINSIDKKAEDGDDLAC